MINFGLISTTLFDTLSQKLEGFIGQNWYFLVIKDRYNAGLVLFVCFWALVLPISAKSQALESAKSTFPDRYVHVSPEAMISWIEEEIAEFQPFLKGAEIVSKSKGTITYQYRLNEDNLWAKITFADCDFDHSLGTECRQVLLLVRTGICEWLPEEDDPNFRPYPLGFSYSEYALVRCQMALSGHLAAEGPLVFFDGLDWFLRALDNVLEGQEAKDIRSSFTVSQSDEVVAEQFELLASKADRYLEFLPTPEDLIPLGRDLETVKKEFLKAAEPFAPSMGFGPSYPPSASGDITLPESGWTGFQYKTECSFRNSCSSFWIYKQIPGLDGETVPKKFVYHPMFELEFEYEYDTMYPSVFVQTEFALNNKGISSELLTEILLSFDSFSSQLLALPRISREDFISTEGGG